MYPRVNEDGTPGAVPPYFTPRPDLKGCNMRFVFYTDARNKPGEKSYVDRTVFGYGDDHLQANIKLWIQKYGIVVAYMLKPKEIEDESNTQVQDSGTEGQQRSSKKNSSKSRVASNDS